MKEINTCCDLCLTFCECLPGGRDVRRRPGIFLYTFLFTIITERCSILLTEQQRVINAIQPHSQRHMYRCYSANSMHLNMDHFFSRGID